MDKVKTSVYMDKELYKKLKILAVENEMTYSELVVSILKKELVNKND